MTKFDIYTEEMEKVLDLLNARLRRALFGEGTGEALGIVLSLIEEVVQRFVNRTGEPGPQARQAYDDLFLRFGHGWPVEDEHVKKMLEHLLAE